MVFWNKVQGSVQYFPEVGATQKVEREHPINGPNFPEKNLHENEKNLTI